MIETTGIYIYAACFLFFSFSYLSQDMTHDLASLHYNHWKIIQTLLILSECNVLMRTFLRPIRPHHAVIATRWGATKIDLLLYVLLMKAVCCTNQQNTTRTCREWTGSLFLCPKTELNNQATKSFSHILYQDFMCGDWNIVTGHTAFFVQPWRQRK